MNAHRGDDARLRALLHDVQRGARSVDDALAALRQPPAAAELGFATVDHDRARRCGQPEVVFCQGKTPTDAAAIAVEILRHADRVLLTRADATHAAAVQAALPQARWHERARCVSVLPDHHALHGRVAVVCAGTADLPVAEEAAVTLEFCGSRVERFTDVGVAGLHRLGPHLDAIRAANAIVVVAGMEGALPSVIGGLVDRPVVAVPTGIGYGASFGGLAALLAMLNSCAAGIGVVNIDNGFGAGILASQINRRCVAASAAPKDLP
ncbi:MAG: nickel pincer cofactor biosynthesis protein LarB [Planctomycetes bacterium]|nr:nickel pincer cofactor biosynthesis protein LarB [Planctomycetota bacterium]